MMIQTKHDLPLECRRQVVEHLNDRLADAIDLVYQAKQAHWNVKGMEFLSLHKLFDRVYEKVDAYVDRFAERLVQLGGVAEGTIQAAAKRSSLAEYPLDIVDGHQHLELLGERVTHFCRNVRQCIEDCDESGDRVSAELMTDVAKDLDELNWMIEAHLFQGEDIGFRAQEGAAPRSRSLRKAFG